MKETFGEECEIRRDVLEKTKEIKDRIINIKKWTPEDILLLFSNKSEDELVADMQRSNMSIRMARGNILPEIISWAKHNNKPFPPNKETIKECLESRT